MKKVLLLLLVLVAGAAVWIFLVPNFQQALQQARQKQAMADVRVTGTAMMAWLTDRIGAVPDGAVPVPHPGSRPEADLLARAKQAPPVAYATFTPAAWTAMRQTIRSVDLASYQRITKEALKALLVPRYIRELPEIDPWGQAYEYYVNMDNPLARHVLLVRSSGRDGTFSGTVYEVGPFASDVYDEDLVWADGYFVRWPERASVNP